MQDYIKEQVTTPIGTVISFMGNKAPKGYLICDGSEYETKDYPDFTEYLQEQFGNINIFGGGSGTFCTPDLRERFLKGSENPGTFEEAGIPNITGYVGSTRSDNTAWLTDSYRGGVFNVINKNKRYPSGSAGGNYIYPTGFDFDASRANPVYGKSETVTPANYGVLMCIKAKYIVEDD